MNFYQGIKVTEELCGRLNAKLFDDATDDLTRTLFPDDSEDSHPPVHAKMEQFTFLRKKFVWELYENNYLKTFKVCFSFVFFNTKSNCQANIPKRRILNTKDFITAPFGSRVTGTEFLHEQVTFPLV